MKVTLKIKRLNPERDAQPWWGEYHLEAEPTDRLLDALNHVKWYQDGTLTYRRSCAHGVCGSDAMLISGRNAPACKVLLRNLGTKITVEPMRGFRVIKDLLVDMEGFFEKYRKVKPYLMTHSPEPEKERLQSPADRERFDDTTKCILCGACTTSCPSFWANEDYLGPAAIVNAHRFIFDSRDESQGERLAILGSGDGVWCCRTIFNCVEACPREINVTRAIGEVMKALLFRKLWRIRPW
ncbi:MAG TPA: succinate dehydrogenase iron-sulfur subunit [Terriglobia bacterium]|nr:succinate dehydrogenase iron-sulfur subunit [Terriglobia bacterium]